MAVLVLFVWVIFTGSGWAIASTMRCSKPLALLSRRQSCSVVGIVWEGAAHLLGLS